MFSFDRQKQIIEILEKDQSLSVTEMSKRLFASASTIRRDLNELEKQGILQRVHGGAVLLSGTNYDPPAAFRKYHNLAEKQRIADLAERFLSPSSAYFFDSSSTATVLATRLEKYPNVRIVTNGIEIPSILQSSEKLSVISCGGSLRSPWGEFTGGITIKTIEEMNADYSAYTKEYDSIIYLVYDLGIISDVQEFKRDFEAKGNVKVIVIKQ